MRFINNDFKNFVTYAVALLLVLSSCSQVVKVKEPYDKNLENKKLAIVSGSIAKLLNSMESYPDMYVSVYEKKESSPKPIKLEDDFFEGINEDRVYALSNLEQLEIGQSHLAVYLSNIEYKEHGFIRFVMTEGYSFSMKYIHEFVVHIENGNVRKIDYVGSLEI